MKKSRKNSFSLKKKRKTIKFQENELLAEIHVWVVQLLYLFVVITPTWFRSLSSDHKSSKDNKHQEAVTLAQTLYYNQLIWSENLSTLKEKTVARAPKLYNLAIWLSFFLPKTGQEAITLAYTTYMIRKFEYFVP